MSSAKWRPFCLGLNVLTSDRPMLVTGSKAVGEDHAITDDLSEKLADKTTILLIHAVILVF